MLTTTILDDTITPTYGCGVKDKPQTLFHGAKFAEYKLVKNHDKHVERCANCQQDDNIDDIVSEFDDVVIDMLINILVKTLTEEES